MGLRCKLGMHTNLVKRTYYNEYNQPYYIEKECKDCGYFKTIGGVV